MVVVPYPFQPWWVVHISHLGNTIWWAPKWLRPGFLGTTSRSTSGTCNGNMFKKTISPTNPINLGRMSYPKSAPNFLGLRWGISIIAFWGVYDMFMWYSWGIASASWKVWFGDQKFGFLFEGILGNVVKGYNSLKLTWLSHLKMDGWKTICLFLLGPGLFSGALAVSFREGMKSMGNGVDHWIFMELVFSHETIVRAA